MNLDKINKFWFFLQKLINESKMKFKNNESRIFNGICAIKLKCDLSFFFCKKSDEFSLPIILKVFNDNSGFIKYKKKLLILLKKIYFANEGDFLKLLKSNIFASPFMKIILIMRKFNISFNKLEITLIERYSHDINIQNNNLINLFKFKLSIFDIINEPYYLLKNICHKCININDCEYLINFFELQLKKFEKISVNNLRNVASLIKLLKEIKLNENFKYFDNRINLIINNLLIIDVNNNDFFEKIKYEFTQIDSFVNFKLDNNIKKLMITPQNELIFSSNNSYTAVAIYCSDVPSKIIFKEFRQYLVGIYIIKKSDYFFDKFNALNSVLNSYLKYKKIVIERLQIDEEGIISIDNIFAKLSLIKNNIRNSQMKIEQKILFSINVNTEKDKKIYIKKLLEIIDRNDLISYGLNSFEILNFLPSIFIQKLEDIWSLTADKQILTLNIIIFICEKFYSFLIYKIGFAYYNINKFINIIYDFINKTNAMEIKFKSKSSIKSKWNEIISLFNDIISVWEPEQITSYTNLDLLWKF